MACMEILRTRTDRISEQASMEELKASKKEFDEFKIRTEKEISSLKEELKKAQKSLVAQTNRAERYYDLLKEAKKREKKRRVEEERVKSQQEPPSQTMEDTVPMNIVSIDVKGKEGAPSINI